MQRALRTDSPIYGRVFAPNVRPSPVSVEHAKQCSPIPEVEYMARLGADLPPRAKPYMVEEVTEAVASLHPGIELAECRFVHDAAFPPLPAVLADGAGGGTICHGPAIEDWRNRDAVSGARGFRLFRLFRRSLRCGVHWSAPLWVGPQSELR